MDRRRQRDGRAVQGHGLPAELQYANNDKALQNQQVDKMIGNGDQLLLIAAVDGGAMNDVLAKAASKKIPVIAYDRLLTGTKNVDYQPPSTTPGSAPCRGSSSSTG